MATLGSDQVSLKADADQGSATLEFSDDIYQRRLERRAGAIATEGGPYLEGSRPRGAVRVSARVQRSAPSCQER